MKSRHTVKRGGLLALAAVALVVFPRPAAAGNVGSVAELIAAINAANQAGGAGGGQALGGGYAVGSGILFRPGDTSSVTLNGGSVVNHNQPDDVHQF
jgi:hypothetical protein